MRSLSHFLCIIIYKIFLILFIFGWILYFFRWIILSNENHIKLTNQNIKQNQPFFSVIIPVFNKSVYLQRSFNSILLQNFSDYEVIYCDDGSTDRSIEIIENFSIHYPNIKLIKHKTNLGTLNTRVDAILYSNGKYILSLDPDDIFEPGLMTKLYSYLSHKQYDIVEFQNYYWLNDVKDYFNNSASIEFNRSVILKRQVRWALFLKCFKREVLIKGIDAIDKKLFELKLTSAEDLVITLHTLPFCYNYLALNFGGYRYWEFLPGSASKCSYVSCYEKRKLVETAWEYSKLFWKKINLTFNFSIHY